MIQQKSSDEQLRRERLRYRIAQKLREQGRTWTNAEMEAWLDAAENKRIGSASNSAPPLQLDLIDRGQHASATRARAALSARDRQAGLRLRIEAAIENAGHHGQTRHELSETLAIPYTSVPAPVLDLIAMGKVVETSRKRPTPTGSPAAVLVLSTEGCTR